MYPWPLRSSCLISVLLGGEEGGVCKEGQTWPRKSPCRDPSVQSPGTWALVASAAASRKMHMTKEKSRTCHGCRRSWWESRELHKTALKIIKHLRQRSVMDSSWSWQTMQYGLPVVERVCPHIYSAALQKKTGPGLEHGLWCQLAWVWIQFVPPTEPWGCCIDHSVPQSLYL